MLTVLHSPDNGFRFLVYAGGFLLVSMDSPAILIHTHVTSFNNMFSLNLGLIFPMSWYHFLRRVILDSLYINHGLAY